MLKEDAEYIYYKIKEEGFDYIFDGYSLHEDIEDEEFHLLRKKYLRSKKKLMEYVAKHVEEEEE